MSESMIETVKIVSEKSDDNPHGFIVINAEDFDAEKHQVFGDDESPQVAVTEHKKPGRKPRQVIE